MARLLRTFQLILLSIALCFGQWVQTNGPSGGFATVNTAYGKYLFASAARKLYRTSDNGSSWTQAGGPSYHMNIIGAYEGILYGYTPFETLSSADSGATWNKTQQGYLKSNALDAALLGNVLVVATNDGFLRSADRGGTWGYSNSGFGGKGVRSLLADEGILYAAGDDGFYVSGDSGVKWIKRSEEPRIEVRRMLLAGSDLLAATDSGVLFSDDSGKTWGYRNQGLTNLVVQGLGSLGNEIFAGCRLSDKSTAGVFRSDNKGESWTPSSQGIPKTAIHSFAVSGDSFFASGGGGVDRAGDRGRTWSPSSNGILSTNINSMFTRDGKPHAIAITGHNSIGWTTTDQGDTWTATENPDDLKAPPDSAKLGRFLFTCQNTLEGLYVTVLSGSGAGTTKTPLVGYGCIDIAVLGEEVFVETGRGLTKSSDSGSTWKILWPRQSYESRRLLFAAGNALYLADPGFLKSTDRGESWSDVSQGIGNSRVLSFAVHGPDMYIGVEWAGVWKRSLADLASGIHRNGWGMERRGFAPGKWIRLIRERPILFEVDRPGHVTLTLHNIHGRLVATLADGFYPAGSHAVDPSGSIPSGTLFLRLSAGARMERPLP